MMGSLALDFTCSAMAVTARRTLAKVKSSAIRPRHPEVPNLIGELLMGRYSSPECRSRKGRRSTLKHFTGDRFWDRSRSEDENITVVGRHGYALGVSRGGHANRQRRTAKGLIQFFGPHSSLWKRHLDRIGGAAEIQDHHGVLFGAGRTSRRMAVKGEQLAALQRLLPVVERLAAAQSAARATQLTEAPVDTNERRAKFIIEIFPVRVAPQVHTGKTVIRQIVIVGKLLAFPKHGNALRGVKRYRQGLETPETTA